MAGKPKLPTQAETTETMGNITRQLSGVAFALHTRYGGRSRQYQLATKALSALDELRAMLDPDIPPTASVDRRNREQDTTRPDDQ